MSDGQRGIFDSLSKALGMRKATSQAQKLETAGDIRDWLVKELAARLDIPEAEIDVRQPFTEYGVDSRTAVSLSGDLERLLGRTLSPTLVWDFPTIEALSEHLVSGAPDAGKQETV